MLYDMYRIAHALYPALVDCPKRLKGQDNNIKHYQNQTTNIYKSLCFDVCLVLVRNFFSTPVLYSTPVNRENQSIFNFFYFFYNNFLSFCQRRILMLCGYPHAFSN